MTKFSPIYYIDENFSKYKSAWDIFKNNKHKFEKPIIMVDMAQHYITFCIVKLISWQQSENNVIKSISTW